MSSLLRSPSQIVNPLARQRMMGYGTGAGGGAFSPLSISSLTEWFDIGSLAAVGNGNPISSWAGIKGLMTLSAATTLRPTYAANDGDGMPAAVFDGVDDTILSGLTNTANIFGSTGDCETWAVVRATAGNRGFFATHGAVGMDSYLFTAAVYIDSPTSANRINSATGINNGAWRVLRLAKTGARRVIQADGSTLYDASTSAGTWTTGNAVFGIGDTSGVKLLGAVRHLLTFNNFLSEADAAAVKTYLEGFN